jgi:hypothetical protein
MAPKIAVLETDVLDTAKKVRDGIEAAGADAVKLASFLENHSTEITDLAALAGPGAANATAVGLSLANLAINAVKKSGSAASANGISITLDSETEASVRALITALEKL